jgi:hypothetical protein
MLKPRLVVKIKPRVVIETEPPVKPKKLVVKLKPRTTEPEPPVHVPETPVEIPWETIPLRELPAKVSPMLLSVYSKAIWTHQSELLVSEKYDGWRVYYRNGVFHTRSGKRIPVPARFYEILAPFRHLDFDGELWLGYGTMSSAGRDDETPSNKDGLEREHRSPERAPQAREGQTWVSLDKPTPVEKKALKADRTKERPIQDNTEYLCWTYRIYEVIDAETPSNKDGLERET